MNLPQIKDYQYEAFLGEGATGQVYAAKQGDQSVSIKILKRLAVNRKLIAYSMGRINDAPNHPNLVELKDFDLDSKPLYIASSLHVHHGADGKGPPRGYTMDSLCGSVDPDLAWAIIGQITEGMAHLHRYGVVHCSLNPKNVMVANADVPEVKIADYGQGWLAEISHIDFSESFLCAPPEQLKSPQLMFEGQAQWWDVYAFGVTAFRLLYKHYPRAQRWINDLREGGVEFHPLAYADVVSKQPEITWPPTRGGFDEQRQRVLERCVALDPSDRYSDMREVIEDFSKIDREERLSLERKQADERERSLEENADHYQKRLGLFRKAAMILAAGLVISLLMNVTSESRVVKLRKQRAELTAKASAELSIATVRGDEAISESKRLKSNLTFSRRNAEVFLAFLLNAKDPYSPESQSIDGYLTSAKDHYKRVLRTTAHDETLVAERLRARLALAMIEGRSGSLEVAAGNLITLIGDIRMLPQASRQLAEIQETLAAALLELGQANLGTNMRDSALKAFQESVQVYNQLVGKERNNKNLDLRRKFGKALYLYGQQLAQSDDLERALRSQQSAMQVLEALAQSGDSREEDEYYLALCQYEVGLIRVWESQGIEAFEAFQLASQGYSRLMDQKPQIPEYRFQLARCLYHLGDLSFQEKGDQDEAKLARESMHELLLMLLDKDESKRDYQYYLALVIADLAEMSRDAGESEDAMLKLDQSIGILNELQKAQPENGDVAHYLARVTALKGDLILDGGDAAAALKQFESAQKIMTTMEDSNLKPSIPKHVRQFYMASFLGAYGHALEEASRKEDAKKKFSRATETLSTLKSRRPNDARVQVTFEALQSRLGGVERRDRSSPGPSN